MRTFLDNRATMLEAVTRCVTQAQLQWKMNNDRCHYTINAVCPYGACDRWSTPTFVVDSNK